MPKTNRARRRKKFDYSRNRKKLNRKFKKKSAPRIECAQIRNAWNDRKTVANNLADMGLAFDPNASIALNKNKVSDDDVSNAPRFVKKPYVIRELEAEASLPKTDTTTVSRDIIEYVQYMIREHSEDYKAMARDEKNYYQDTPKQIKRKVELYKRCHPEDYTAFIESIKTENMKTD